MSSIRKNRIGRKMNYVVIIGTLFLVPIKKNSANSNVFV